MARNTDHGHDESDKDFSLAGKPWISSDSWEANHERDRRGGEQILCVCVCEKERYREIEEGGGEERLQQISKRTN